MSCLHRTRRQIRTPVALMLLTALLALALLFAGPPAPAPAGNAKTRDAIVRELGSLVKELKGAERLDADSKRFREKMGNIEFKKGEMIRAHLGFPFGPPETRVYGSHFGSWYLHLENLDLDLRRASVPGLPAEKILRDALASVSSLEFLVSDSIRFGLPEGAKTDLATLKTDLESVLGGVAFANLEGKKLRRRTDGIEKAKHEILRVHFASQLVFGLHVDLLYRLLACADLQLQEAFFSSKEGKEGAARGHMKQAKKCLSDLRGAFLAVPPTS